MQKVIETILIGFSSGSIYALMSLALVLVWRSTRVVNFAQAGQAMLSTYIGFEIASRSEIFWLGLVFAIAAGLADRCEVQVAYAIGKAQPVGLFIETFGTEKASLEKISKAVEEVFDLRPAAIIRDLDLLRPIYNKTAAYGHFGRELPEFTWERTDRASALKSLVN